MKPGAGWNWRHEAGWDREERHDETRSASQPATLVALLRGGCGKIADEAATTPFGGSLSTARVLIRRRPCH